MQEIASGIFVETGYMGATIGAIVLPHGTILIDAPLKPEDARSWRASLANQGSSGNRLLVNLDPHPDRTLGARAMDLTIIAHQKAAQIFRGRPSVFKGQNFDSGSEWETYNDAVGIRWAIPDITFSDNISLHWGPPDVLLEQHPGPAQGAIWAIIPDKKVVFVGDAVLLDQPPFLSNADISEWLETLEVLNKSFGDYIIVSGRGGPVPNSAVKAQQQILKKIVREMEKLSKKHAQVEATEKLVAGLIKDMGFPPHLQEQYEHRLLHGLNQYYARKYRAQDSMNLNKTSESDE